MRSRVLVMVMVGLSGLSLTACAAPVSSATGQTVATTSPATPTPADSLTSTSEHDESIPHDHDVEVNPNADADVTELATRTVTLFCRPSLAYATWIAELYPVVSQSAAVAYETVDPANVPCTSVTGEAQIRDTDGAYTARVLVPTDAGDYSVYVHRPLDTAPWAVEQITPLASE